MKGRSIRMITLLWLGWYLSGPVCETVDRWDGPRQEVGDILFNAGGGLVILAAAALAGPRLLKRLREAVVRSLVPNRMCPVSVSQGIELAFSIAFLTLTPSYSPPGPLRI